MHMLEDGCAGETRGTARKGAGAGAGRRHRVSGKHAKDSGLDPVGNGEPWKFFSREVRRWDSHQAAGWKMNSRAGEGLGEASSGCNSCLGVK